MGASLTLAVHYGFSRWMLAMREAADQTRWTGKGTWERADGESEKSLERGGRSMEGRHRGDAKGKEHEKERRSASVIAERYWAMLHRCGCGYWIRYVSVTLIHTFPKTLIREYG
jgi:hypothetical protein